MLDQSAGSLSGLPKLRPAFLCLWLSTWCPLYLPPPVLTLCAALQDEECLRPGEATDLTFLEKLEDTVKHHPHFLT